jgi:glucose/arabinose dehydrogenase
MPGRYVRPLDITHAGDGSGRLFVVEKRGMVWIVLDEQRLSIPFLDISDRVGNLSEAGLLSMAFPPDFAEQGYFFVHYNSKENVVAPDQPREPNGAHDTIIARFRLTDDPNVADPASEEPILKQNQPASNHNGGQLAFGPDGYLYIGLGDGGGNDDVFANGQDPSSLLAKLLRIEVGATGTYTVPADNPFVDDSDYRPEIWAEGLRNPWRFSFDRLTGDLYIADVGEDSYEEINFQPATSRGGENYGWNVMEGLHCFRSTSCAPSRYTLPVAEYPHNPNDECTALIGGVVFTSSHPAHPPLYLYGDWCTGILRGLQRSGDQWISGSIMDTPMRMLSFGEDETGQVYIGDDRGMVYRVSARPEPVVRLRFPTVYDYEPATSHNPQ